jgi:hypothetical protein
MEQYGLKGDLVPLADRVVRFEALTADLGQQLLGLFSRTDAIVAEFNPSLAIAFLAKDQDLRNPAGDRFGGDALVWTGCGPVKQGRQQFGRDDGLLFLFAGPCLLQVVDHLPHHFRGERAGFDPVIQPQLFQKAFQVGDLVYSLGPLDHLDRLGIEVPGQYLGLDGIVELAPLGSYGKGPQVGSGRGIVRELHCQGGEISQDGGFAGVFAGLDRMREQERARLMCDHILGAGRSSLRMAPPLIVDEYDVDTAVGMIDEILGEVRGSSFEGREGRP